jgi:hypothetical protein
MFAGRFSPADRSLHNTSVDKVTGYGLNDPDSVPGRGRSFLDCLSVRSPYPTDTADFVGEVKRPEHQPPLLTRPIRHHIRVSFTLNLFIRGYLVFGLCPSSGILNKTMFRKLDLLPSSGVDMGGTYCVRFVRKR